MPDPTRTGSLNGTGDLSLHWQAWLPDGAARAVVVVAHGGAEHGGRYRHLVERLLPDGFAVYALDQRGHGLSEGPRAYVERIEHTVADLDRMIGVAAGGHSGAPVFLLGHSMGGCMAVAYALEHQSRLRGLILSAPVTMLEAPAPLRAVVRALSVVAPRLGVVKVDASTISRDAEEVRAYDEDPLVYRGKLPARTLAELADATASFPSALPRVTLPLLVVHGTADRLIPVACGKLAHERAGSEDKTLRLYDGYFHELFNEPPGERDRPLDDVAAWLEAHV